MEQCQFLLPKHRKDCINKGGEKKVELQFKQYRYFGSSSSKNNITREQLLNGTGLTNIIELGLRALPGTKFYINNSTDPVVVGYTGLFEIDFSSGGSVTSIRFDRQTVDFIDDNLNGGYIIIDLLQRGGN